MEVTAPHIMVTATGHITEYSARAEFSDFTSDQKILACDRKIAQLTCELLYYKSQLQIQSDGITTKKGRLSQLSCSDNSVLKKQVRNTMQKFFFSQCKFISKKSLYDLRKDKLGSIIMDELNIGVRKAVNGETCGAIEQLNFKDRMVWWHRNCELVEQLFVEHRTKKTQELKIRYMTGKYKCEEIA